MSRKKAQQRFPAAEAGRSLAGCATCRKGPTNGLLPAARDRHHRQHPLRDDGLAFELPLVDPDERQPSCGLHAGDYKEDLSAPSPRTRFTVRRFGGSFGA